MFRPIYSEILLLRIEERLQTENKWEEKKKTSLKTLSCSKSGHSFHRTSETKPMIYSFLVVFILKLSFALQVIIY